MFLTTKINLSCKCWASNMLKCVLKGLQRFMQKVEHSTWKKKPRHFIKCTLLLLINQWVCDIRKSFLALFVFAMLYFRVWTLQSSGQRLLKGARYRFTGVAGWKMPESPPDPYMCGTIASGWLNGTHPSVAEGNVHWSRFFQEKNGSYNISLLLTRD